LLESSRWKSGAQRVLYQFLRHLLNPIQDFQKVGRAVQRADFGTRTARKGVRALP
jgi:hypothetical protein